ncbi:MAG: YchJ family protein [Reichenbachiella sp.]|uniref:YchJ family protein n=1 Tax=Reichenbachiella sp. TaxID=2184521 RepID=UPI0032989CA0
MKDNNCLCGSKKNINECCGTIIKGEPAKTALALMRSRYTAYCLSEAQYLYNTTHSKHRAAYKIEGIEQWARENTWNQLEIVSVAHGSVSDTKGVVEFKAYFTDPKGKKQVHHERSNFLKEDENWYYLDGEINPKEIDLMKKVHRNDPCPCGSGKKYKKCCG